MNFYIDNVFGNTILVSTLDEYHASKKSCCYRYYAGHKINFNLNVFHKKNIIQRVESFDIPDLFLCKIYDGFVFGKNGVGSGEVIYKESMPSWININNLSKDANFLERIYNLNIIEDRKVDFPFDQNNIIFEDDPIFVLCSYTDNAFSHFLFETFAKLSQVYTFDINKYKWVVSSSIKDYQMEMLVDFGIPMERIIKKDPKKVIVAKEIVFLDSPAHNNNWAIPSSLVFMRNFFLENRLRNGFKPKALKKIYLDRNDERSDFRKILNEENIFSLFESFGFVKFTPGFNKFPKKAEVISNADVIVGQYGGGLQLAFMAKQGAKIVVLQSPKFFRGFISYIGAIFGFDVVNIIGEVVVLKESDINNSDFIIEMENIEALTQVVTSLRLIK